MACKYASLTDNGINKIVNDKNFNSPILQIVDFNEGKKQIGGDQLYQSDISDGFAKLRCYFCNEITKKIEENLSTLLT